MLFLSTIRSRLALAFFTLIVIIIFSEFVAYHRISRLPNALAIGEITQMLTSLQKEEVALKASATEFILLEKNNSSFFQTGQSKFLDRYKKSLSALTQSIESVEKLADNMNITNAEEIYSLTKALHRYDTIFQTMVLKIKERGYGKFGIVGEFDNSIMDLMRHDFGVDNVAILNLQLYVRDYLLSGNKGATNDVANEIYNFSTVLERYVKDEQVESVINSLANYEGAFEKLVAADDRLGTYSGQGLARDLFTAATVLDASVQLAQIKSNVDETYTSVSSEIYFSILMITCIAILAAIGISWWVNSTIVRPFREIKKVISLLGLGEIPSRLSAVKLQDLNELVVASNNLISSIGDHHDFAHNIGKGNFNASIRNMSEKDVLGKALLQMRDSLQQADAENKQRTWITQCLAEFTHIIRNRNQDKYAIGKQMVSKIAKDMGVQLAGFYLINDHDAEDVFIELVSAYGFDLQKLSVRRIEMGQGLLGQSIVSKETNYLSPVPDNYYVRIASGLGQSMPIALLIVPLKHNDVIVGAVEVASLEEISEYKRIYVEKLAESIASFISSASRHTERAGYSQQSDFNLPQLKLNR